MRPHEEINEIIDKLYENILPQNVHDWIDDVDKVIKMFLRDESIYPLFDMLDLVEKELRKKQGVNDQEKELLKRLSGINGYIKARKTDTLIEVLQYRGATLAKDVDFVKSVESIIYRLLEQTRLGKRENVIHMLLRLCTTRGKKFPQELVAVLKPNDIDDNMFKACVYAFLSGFIKEKKKEDDRYE
ncbi:hypothetical protein [Candidatus Magnetobacterium casense]|uniref:DUF1641 domain-containing protein n=1 Tax=Candidatus Magnetobacterium casense TaxID=1455061 RepID=A0ABS6RWM0_9BACT|nr:hypothetical protein [Candidatus Magnetobacterium casensis]MBV6341016.1 hypothetical protein [Candidatus Magnetobacterium casensis]